MVTGKLGAGILGPRRRLQALCVKGSGMENLEARLAEGSPQPCCLRAVFPEQAQRQAGASQLDTRNRLE